MESHVSFVIVNWGHEDATAACVESVKAQKTNATLEIIVVDNESSPTSELRLRSIPGINLIVHSDNRGFTGGMNAGFAAAASEYLAALNNDLVIAPDWLETGLAELTEKDVAVVGGTEFFWDEHNPRDDDSNELFSLLLIDPEAGYGHRTGKATPTQDVDALGGSNLLMRREVVNRLGGFDNDFFTYYEDVDLCARALALGYRVRFCSEMHVWHRRNLSSDRMPLRRRFLAERNHLLFVARHFPDNIWRRTVRRLSLQYVLFGVIGREAGLRRWKTGKPVGAADRIAHLASGLWGLSHRKYLKEKRRQLSAIGQRSDSYVTHLRSRLG